MTRQRDRPFQLDGAGQLHLFSLRRPTLLQQRVVHVLFKCTARLAAVMLQEYQLVELDLFWVITRKAFADVVGQIEIHLPTGAAAYRALLDVYFTTARADPTAAIDDALCIEPLLKVQLGQKLFNVAHASNPLRSLLEGNFVCIREDGV